MEPNKTATGESIVEARATLRNESGCELVLPDFSALNDIPIVLLTDAEACALENPESCEACQ